VCKLTLFVQDIEIGQPVSGMEVSLYQVLSNSGTRLLWEGVTQHDGCVRIGPPINSANSPAHYRAIYQTERYFNDHGRVTFFPTIQIDFPMHGDNDLVLPLLICPFAYTVYRGS
jgi:5-hydroxyisourate hydrolase-like protein (transthyretin family)